MVVHVIIYNISIENMKNVISESKRTKWNLRATLKPAVSASLLVALIATHTDSYASSVFAAQTILQQQQEQIRVNGSVVGNSAPLSGVSVSVVGQSSLSTVTDAKGHFQLLVPKNSVLRFSFMGYENKEVVAQNNMQVSLEANSTEIQETVVVGYGVQRKVNLTGAVDMISSKELESRPIANLGAGLQGLIPNLNITTSNGRASTNPSFNVRGFTSINGGSPLILVDNIPYSEDEVARLNPSDVESVTVLKDAAAAAIYGARGGFGVVLITTKNAKSEKLDVAFNTNIGLRTLGKLPAHVSDPYLAMSLKHEAGKPLYSLYPESSREYARRRSLDPSLSPVTLSDDGQSYVYTGETKWLDEAYNKTAPTYNANLSLSKKMDKMSYYMSANYYRQEGLLRYGNDIYNRYNMRAKVDLDVTDWLKVSNNTLLSSNDYDAPVFLDDLFFWNINRTNSLDVPRNPDGSWTSAGAQVLGALQEGGRKKDRRNEFLTTFTAKASILKDVWDINGDVTFRRAGGLTRSFDIPVAYKTGPEQPEQYTFANSWAKNDNLTNRYTVVNLYTDFHKKFGDHYLQAMLGYNQEYANNISSWVRRNDLISTTLPSTGIATGDITTDEVIKDWAVQGIFSRLAYSFQDKYLVEFNGRYDGTSRFPSGKRWGFFPSGSMGWVVSQENFFQPVKNAIAMDMLKFRASYGTLGNQTFSYDSSSPYYDTYPYIPVMQNGQVGYVLGSSRPQMVGAPGAVTDNFTWESISTVNFGADMAFLNNRLGVNFDVYTRYTNDMLIPGKALPAVFGAPVPRENSGDLKTKGWELRLSWRDSKELAGSPFSYNVAFTLADNKAVITRYDNPTKSLGSNWDRYYVGREIGEIWGADIIGFFDSDDAVNNHPNQSAMGTDDQSYRFYAGDPIFADRNGDGVVDMGDRTVENPGDMHVIGNNAPRLPFSLDLSAGWKNFDLRVFMQGVAKRDWYAAGSNIYFWGVFSQPWTNPTEQNLDHWTPENPDAYFPAIRAYSAEDNYQQLGIPNKRYMQDASYMRVKNMTLGYTLPSSVLERMNLGKLRFFVSGENLFEVSHIKVKLDPEALDNESAYPFQRTFTAGLSLNF